MNDADRRMANMRLQAGGDVTPDNARHMGLFVVSRIAARHGIRVGLRGPRSSTKRGAGTTAEVYLPPTVLDEACGGGSGARRGARGRQVVSSPSAARLAQMPIASGGASRTRRRTARRRAGAGRTGSAPRPRGPSRHVAAAPRPGFQRHHRRSPAAEQQPRRQRRELATPWWEGGAAG